MCVHVCVCYLFSFLSNLHINTHTTVSISQTNIRTLRRSVLPVSALPVLPSGKVNRKALPAAHTMRLLVKDGARQRRGPAAAAGAGQGAGKGGVALGSNKKNFALGGSATTSGMSNTNGILAAIRQSNSPLAEQEYHIAKVRAAMQRDAVQRDAVQCAAMKCNAMQCNAMQL